MTAMTEAIKSAGLAVPVNKRVWLWLKDHPNKTAGEISCALGVPREGNIPGVLNDLLSRGMVVSTMVPRAPNVLRGPAFVKSYSTRGARFELLPRRKIPLTSPAKHFADTPTPAPEPEKVVGKFAINVENMTLRDAKALYLQLKAIFE